MSTGRVMSTGEGLRQVLLQRASVVLLVRSSSLQVQQ